MPSVRQTFRALPRPHRHVPAQVVDALAIGYRLSDLRMWRDGVSYKPLDLQRYLSLRALLGR
ncbi:MAG: hypothetical protein H6721_15835 [Sandaracinus sp.]|nr:hypothetical protein [Sandaracinus sp.]MCB9633587.1 hypothetical protein [Sandaracinus sp.]